MSDADDRLLLCQQILGELGTRSTITSVDPPDGSTEAYYCNLLFNNTRDTLLRAAHWGFAGRTDAGLLWKALPGTPENPQTLTNYAWSNRDPAPPWLYSYTVRGMDSPFPPDAVIQVRRIRGRDQPVDSIPFFDGQITAARSDCAPFEMGTDRYDRAGNRLAYVDTIPFGGITIVSHGEGYQPGDYITMTQSGASYGQAPVFQVQVVRQQESGVLQIEVNEGGTFTAWTTEPFTQASTSGAGTGFTCTATLAAHHGIERVILTNARNILVDFTTSDINISEWDPGFQNAFMSALEGKLALSLLGDKAMAKLKLEQANGEILEARVRDGNEGLTTYDHVPDWLSVRGVSSMGSPWVNPPYYGPLFAV